MRLPSAVLATLSLISPALANDSTASIAAGGLELVANDIVELVREDLTIGPDRVTVRYQFRNPTAADFHTIVAFPLPAVDLGSMYDTDLGPMTTDSINYVSFSVTVNGRAVTPEAETKATVGGRSVESRLREFHLPLSGFDPGIFTTLETLPRYARTMLEAEGIAWFDEHQDQVYAQPAWTFQTLYYWQQSFPAGADTVIEHSYRPVAGAQFFGREAIDAIRGGEDRGFAQFCPGEELLAKAEQRIGDDGLMIARNVDYILTTANNWSGPIGLFHLTIVKGAPDHLASACIEGLTKTGPVTLEATMTDFSPAEELKVLFLETTSFE
jgi:hypothetical protein